MLLDDLEHLFYKKNPELLTQNNRPVTNQNETKAKQQINTREKIFVPRWNLLTF